jgi:hypothetical protein
MEERGATRRDLEQKTRILKQLEGVYKTSTSIAQKQRVYKEIQELKKVIKELQQRSETIGFEEKGEEGSESWSSAVSILGRIKISKFKKDSKDREMDAVVSYMHFFEASYLPILSARYIKFDYSHSGKRDTFYPRFMEIMHLLKQYDYEDELQQRKELERSSLYRDKSVMQKGRQMYLFALDSFFKDMRNFLKVAMDDNETGGTILMNPDDIIHLEEFEENKKLNNYSVIKALQEIYTFSDEFIKFLAMPEI